MMYTQIVVELYPGPMYILLNFDQWKLVGLMTRTCCEIENVNRARFWT